jgi:hypothetical protein
MVQTPPEILVQPDAFRVTREPLLLVSELRAALAVCLFDDTQAVGGLLHLRYVATSGTEPVDLTDNTLSSDLLLMDSFCKELRSRVPASRAGASASSATRRSSRQWKGLRPR